MIIHRGRGGLVFVITFACLFITELFTRNHFHDDRYYQQHKWPALIGFLAAAAIIQMLIQRKPQVPAAQEKDWLVSSSIDPNPEGLDTESNMAKWRIFRKSDSFFVIPIRFWPWILCALGILMYVLPLSLLE
jgi:hypothetical protein